MQGVKITWVGRSFAFAAPSDSCGHKKSGRRKTREERHTLIKSFVEKYKTSNKGDFPSISLTHKEVGGSYYTVREIMRELKQEHKLCDTLGTDLDVMEPEEQAIRHVVEPLSIPGEISMLISSSSNHVVESNHCLEPMEAKYQDVLPDKEEQEIFIDNGSVESCGHNDQTSAKQENQVVDNPLKTIAAPLLLGMEHLQEVKMGQSLEKKEKNESKSFMWDDNPNNEKSHDLAIVSHIPETVVVGNGSLMESYSSQVENVCKHEAPRIQKQECKDFHGNKSPAVIVGNDCVIESYISHMENVSKHEASNVWEQEFNVNDKTSSAVLSLCEDAAVAELQSSYDLGPDSSEKQNLPEPLEKLEVSFPAVLENASLSVTKNSSSPDSPLAENSSSLEYSEGYDTHSPLDTTQPVYSTSDSHSTTCLRELPVDLACGANHDEENSQLSNSTDNMLEEPTTLADKINSSMANFHTTAGETAEIQDGMMECQQLYSPTIDQEQMLTGVQVQSLDALQKVSSELQSENLNNFSSTNCNRDLTGKTASVPLSIVPQQGPGESIGNAEKNMQNNGNDETENPISISENVDGTSANTECFEGPKKQENNIILAILKTIAEGILYLFKE